MEKRELFDPIDEYIKEIDELLPYPDINKVPVLNELRKDIQDAVGDDKRPLSVIFGSTHEVAKNLSLAQDWGTKTAGWRVRALAMMIDALFITSLLIIALLPLYFIVIPKAYLESRFLIYSSVSILIGLPTLVFSCCYYIILETTYSTTLGKRMLELIVVDESGIKITWSQALIRNLTKVPLATQFLPFDVLIGIFSEKTRGKKQRVLDFVAGTVVVKRT